MRDLGLAITRDIYLESPNVRWEDIKGLDQAKKLLKEAVVMPIKYPELFTGETAHSCSGQASSAPPLINRAPIVRHPPR